jgi:hypothetical protein
METLYETLVEQSPRVDTRGFSLSIIPVNSNKIPIQPWKKYESKIAPVSYWHQHYLDQKTVGVVCGKVSGNLEIIDIDVKNDPTKAIWDDYKKLIPPDLLKRLIIQTTPNYGFHLIFRCPDATIEPNQKLAHHSDKAVIIETRGEGGYFCTSQTRNKIVQGIFNLKALEVDIPEITAQERNQLLEIARSLTRLFPSKPDKPFHYSEPAINDFNAQFDIVTIFEKHDWQVVKDDGEKVHLLRDGSAATHSGYYFKDTKTFFCFSTSTEFTPSKPYNNFQVFQLLEGKDDYKTTLRLLPDYGFQVEGKVEKISSDDIAAYLNGKGLRYDAFVQDLTFNDKVVDERDYNTIYVDMKKHFGKEIARTRFEEIAKSTYITEVHPILDYIEANKQRKPVGTFEQWLNCLTLKNPNIDKSIVLHFFKKWYVGMVAQALDGEYPNEFFLTLLSVEQGIGKTTMLRKYTLPVELQKFRVEHSLSFDDDFKVLMGQALLIIDDEMDGRTYEMEKTFKTVLSNKEQTTRRKYDRRISTIKRRCSFAGSGNNLNVVREQGNRRIIPVEISQIDKAMLAKVDLNDLFMEAYNLYVSGFKYSYQQEDIKLLNQLNEEYIQKSDVDLILDDYLELPVNETDVHYISNLELVQALIMKFPQFSKRLNVPTIGKQMNDRGFSKFRKGKKKISTYAIGKGSKITEVINSDSHLSGGKGNSFYRDSEPWLS